jgi:glycerophosphoryl diester phosphodiesterase
VHAETVKISAHGHSAHADNGTMAAFERALGTGADYIEFNVRSTADGELVAFHNRCTPHGNPLSAISYQRLCDLVRYEVPKVAEVMTTIKGHAKAHLDLKEVGGEDEIVQAALEILGPRMFIVTTLEDASVRAIRSQPRFQDVPVALSLGRDMKHASRMAWLRTRISELRPLPRLQACGADWAAAEHRLAFAGVQRQCRRHQFKVMVWTVNDEREIRYWLASHRADVLITDQPALAVALREQIG